jgi:hypothetical protein
LFQALPLGNSTHGEDWAVTGKAENYGTSGFCVGHLADTVLVTHGSVHHEAARSTRRFGFSCFSLVSLS